MENIDLVLISGGLGVGLIFIDLEVESFRTVAPEEIDTKGFEHVCI